MQARMPHNSGERVRWTKRPLLLVTGHATAIVALYRWTDGAWISLPWSLLTMLGLTLAITTGFKAMRGHARVADVQRLWASITAASRSWTLLSRSVLQDGEAARQLAYRHLAWLAMLCRQLRSTEEPEGDERGRGLEGGVSRQASEKAMHLQRELVGYVGAHECERILAADDPSSQVLRLQSEALKALLAADKLNPAPFLELHRLLHELQRLQAAAEGMKDDPDTRRCTHVDGVLLGVFGLLLPFGLLDAMGPLVLFDDHVIGALACWSIVPLSAMLTWLYLALGRAGREGCHPFDGGSIHRACLLLEHELRTALTEEPAAAARGMPAPLLP